MFKIYFLKKYIKKNFKDKIYKTQFKRNKVVFKNASFISNYIKY